MTSDAFQRLPLLSPIQLRDDQQRVYQAIVEGPRQGSPGLTDANGCLRGPFNAMLYSPAIGGLIEALGAAIRYKSSFSDRVRELAILTVAAYCNSEFEWVNHEPLALKCGWRPEQLRAIRESREPEIEDPDELVTWRVVAQLLTVGDLGDQEYQRAFDRLGPTALVELSTLIGYYRLLALQLRIFQIPVDQ